MCVCFWAIAGILVTQYDQALYRLPLNKQFKSLPSVVRTKHLWYYLYSFEGALTDKHLNDIDKEKKQELKAMTNG